MEKRYKDKLIIINDAFQSKNFDTVVQESCKIFEVIMKQLYIEALGKLDSKSRKELMNIEYSNDKSIGIDTFSFGQVIGLYKKSNFFSILERSTNRDYSMLRAINFELINDLRNASAHMVKQIDIIYGNAEYVYSSLKIFLATLGYAEFEKYLGEMVSKRISHSNTVNNIQNNTTEVERTSNKYDVMDKKEKRRIAFQRRITRKHDVKSISSVIEKKESVAILDIGCNDGSLILDRVDGMTNISAIVGVDSNEEMISNNINRCDKNNVFYICSDCEKDDFLDDIQDLMKEKKIEKFDLIVLSMILLHVKNPFKLLKNARALLKADGSLYIRDMDDGLTVAFPDDKNLVSRALDISNRVPYTGYRHCGRQVYSILKKCGFREVEIVEEIIDTVNMNFDERNMLFVTNFSYIKGDLELAYKESPEEFEDDYIWFQSAYDELEELFQLEGFYYRMGSIVFLAKKEE